MPGLCRPSCVRHSRAVNVTDVAMFSSHWPSAQPCLLDTVPPPPPPRETGRKLRGLSHTANVCVTWVFLVPKPTGANPACRGAQSAVVNQPLSCPELSGLQNRGAVEHWGVGRHTHTQKARGALESDTCKIGSGSGKRPAPGQQPLVAMEVQKDQ